MRIKESLRGRVCKIVRLFFLFVVGLQSLSGYADFTGVRLGISYPTPLGTSFQTLDHTIGGAAGAWYSPSWLDPSWISLRLSGAYEPFYVRNMSSVTVSTASLLGGVQIQAGVFGTGFMSYLGLDVGAVYNWMGIATSVVTQNSALALSTQIVPGFDYAITQDFGIVLEMPFKVVFLRSPLSLFSSSISLRLKL